MALPGSGIVNRGLQITGGRVFATADAFLAVQTLCVDDNATNFAAADTALNTSRGAVANVKAKAFDATPTRAGQTISMVTTLTTAEGNFTIRGISLHNDVAANVNAGSATLFAGVAGQSIVKSASFSLALTLTVIYTDNS